MKIIEDMKKYDDPWNIEAILDNDSSKWGNCVGDNISITDPKILDKYNKENVVVLICSKYAGIIGEQLHCMNVKYYFSEFWLSTSSSTYYQQDIEAEKVNMIKSILSDSDSKLLFQKIVDKRKNGIMDYTDIKYWNVSEYFLEEFWKPSKNGDDVFIDGGGYTGDTIDEFVEWTHGKYKHVYSFEPQKDKAEIIRMKLWKYNDMVSFFEKGLWSKETTIGFCDGNNEVSGKIVEKKSSDKNLIETVALDDVVHEKVTFIKMDIEGAEKEALYGAKNIILRDKPNLAICIYHKLDDLWEIPLMVHEMVPEYKLYIRHMGVRCYGTILYAVV